MFRKRSVLRGQVLWPLLIFEIVALLIIGVAIVYFYLGQFQSTLALQQETATFTATNVEGYVSELQSVLETAGQNQDLTSLPSLQQRVALSQIKGQYHAYENLLIVNRQGEMETQATFVADTPPLPENWREHEAFIRVMAGNTYVGPVEYHRGLVHTFIAAPIRDAQLRIVGMLAAQIDLNAPLWSIVAPTGSGETGYTYVVNSEGNLIVSHNITLLRHHEETRALDGVQAAIEGDQPRAPYVGLIGIINAHHLQSGQQNQGWLDQLVVGGVHAIPSLGWYVIAELPVTEAYAYLFSLIPLLGVQILVSVGLASAVWFYVNKRVVNPILEMTKGAQIIGNGQLDHRIEVDAGGELATLAHVINATAAQLRDLIDSLEQRVSGRTRDLERRALELEAASHVAREAASIRDVKRLLDETVHLISVLFGFYHAGIFLLDDVKEYAILQAASSEGGQKMLARQHRLKVGSEGIVGYVAHQGIPRIALDVGEDAVFFNNPDLPQTRSEMALPLAIRGQVIGVLDVQSTEAAAFSEEDVTVVQTMADQLAVAIDNARLLEESQKALQELQTLYGQLTREAWQKRTRQSLSAYRYTGVSVEPVSDAGRPSTSALQSGLPSEGEAIEGQMDAAETEKENENGNQVFAPIYLRGQNLGSIVLRRGPEAAPWTAEEIALLNEVSAQIGLALENARLLEETQQRARQDRIIADITAQVRSSLDPETILQTAVRELGAALGTDRAFVRLGARRDGEAQLDDGPEDKLADGPQDSGRDDGRAI